MIRRTRLHRDQNPQERVDLSVRSHSRAQCDILLHRCHLYIDSLTSVNTQKHTQLTGTLDDEEVRKCVLKPLPNLDEDEEDVPLSPVSGLTSPPPVHRVVTSSNKKSLAKLRYETVREKVTSSPAVRRAKENSRRRRTVSPAALTALVQGLYDGDEDEEEEQDSERHDNDDTCDFKVAMALLQQKSDDESNHAKRTLRSVNKTCDSLDLSRSFEIPSMIRSTEKTKKPLKRRRRKNPLSTRRISGVGESLFLSSGSDHEDGSTPLGKLF